MKFNGFKLKIDIALSFMTIWFTLDLKQVPKDQKHLEDKFFYKIENIYVV